MKPEELAALNDEIAGMARAGLPLDQGLAALAKEMGRGRLKRVTAELAADLQEGRTLPEALERQAGRVPPFYAGLVSAGIRTGKIGEVLATLTTYARSIANLRTIVIEAMFYPTLVLFLAVIPSSVLAFYILPQFDEIFKSFGMKLPYVTELVLGLARYPLELLVVPITIIVVGVLVLRQTLLFTERGRCAWARLVYAVPIVGTLIRSARLAAFTDLLAIMLDHKLPLPEAFRLAGEASSDPIVAVSARQATQDLSQGMPLAEVMRGRSLTPEWVAWMMGMGERRGSLGETLHHIAETYRKQVEMRAALLRTTLAPFLIVCTAGIFVVFFIFALMLPLIKLMEGLSK